MNKSKTFGEELLDIDRKARMDLEETVFLIFLYNEYPHIKKELMEQAKKGNGKPYVVLNKNFTNSLILNQLDRDGLEIKDKYIIKPVEKE